MNKIGLSMVYLLISHGILILMCYWLRRRVDRLGMQMEYVLLRDAKK